MSQALSEISLPGIPLFKRGKVRDVFDLGDKLLIVASDRISAFDYVLPSLIPGKGAVLTQLAAFWFDHTALVCPNHVITADAGAFPLEIKPHRALLDKRSMLVRKSEVLPVECVVRGYLAGSGWAEYKTSGRVCGIKLRPGLVESDRLDQPIFTPATKAEQGHDENISFKSMQKIVGSKTAEAVRKLSLELYQRASLHAVSKGILVADTKFEFGLIEGTLILVDEIFTPDSSRFWPLASYAPGRSQASLDKQYVRDYLLSTGWDRSSPPPRLPPEVIDQTAGRYLEIFKLLAGRDEP
ncbi:MAG: phosphoribosylaminoimidazolesuccinocarboxamide synthase [Candidatus Aminicenantes bacterium RBG_13_62_12]|nr:MAG: phosphoribosylaminoimidazolesuccinocarboxamide synthase [Candidatus Aminicenantes bacterium RBG_13_62_12]